MKKLYFFMLCAFTVPAFAQTTVLKNKINKKADSLESQIIAWRRDFHEHPELGNHEFRTAGIIAKQSAWQLPALWPYYAAANPALL
jgi:hypothetical protein